MTCEGCVGAVFEGSMAGAEVVVVGAERPVPVGTFGSVTVIDPSSSLSVSTITSLQR